MNADEAMFRLLANSCSDPADEKGWNEYTISLCCGDLTVIARPIEGTDHWEADNDGDEVLAWQEYEIKSMGAKL